MSTAKPKTPAQVRAELDARGETIAAWAKRHGFKRLTVQDLLCGRIKGRWGEAHNAAVMLGLKVGEPVSEPRQSA